MMKQYLVALRYLIRFLLLFSIIAALIVTRQLLMRLCLSVLVAYMLSPAAVKLEDFSLSRIATNLRLIVSTIILAGSIIYRLTLLIITFTDDLPPIQEQINSN